MSTGRIGGREETVDHEEVVAQLSVGESTFWVADESPRHLNHSPESLVGGTVRMLLTVPDPDEAVQRALTAGAEEVSAVDDRHGWRLGRIADPFGHHREIGTALGAGPRRDESRGTDEFWRDATFYLVEQVGTTKARRRI
jgi:PhnB protein